MKGVVPVGNYKVEVRDFPIPEPKEGEVLIDVKCAGICGSDINTFRMTWEQIGERQNLIIGHEAGGIVAKTGPGVKSVKPGDRVCVYHYMGCGKCIHCLNGVYGWCEKKRAYGWHVNGAMAEYLITEEINCARFPKALNLLMPHFLHVLPERLFFPKTQQICNRRISRNYGSWPDWYRKDIMAKAKGWQVVALTKASRE